jgi:hypothetical protein
MSQEKVSKVEDLTKLTAIKLKAFLKERNIPGHGTKAELLQLARLYYSRPVIRVSASGPQIGKAPFDALDLQWTIVSHDSRVQVIILCSYFC